MAKLKAVQPEVNEDDFDSTEIDLVDLEIVDQMINNPEAGLDEEDLALMRELEGEASAEEVVVEEVVAPVKKKRAKNYVNNADLLIQYKLSREQDRMTEEFAKMLQMIAARYALKPNFRDYSYVEDMKAYSMMMVVRTWRSFNPLKSSNPFAFFTQCIKNSFKQYLKVERRVRDVRDEMLLSVGLNPSHTYADEYSGGSDDSFGGGGHYDY